MAILLKNGLVYQEGEFINEDVLTSGSNIQAIGLDLPEEGAEVYDLKGKLLAHGLVDIHEHYREPGFTYKETIKTGSEAAARGGFTMVCTMPNVDPVPDDLETFEKQVALNEANSCVHLKQYGAITEDLTSDRVVDMAALKEAGAFAFSNDGHGIQQAGTMYEAMQEAAKVGLAICEHIQDDSLYHHGVMNAGKKAKELGLPGILGVSESAQLARDLVLAQATGVHYHACHVSTKESVELIRIAKEYGINVTAEAAPHHLLLSEEEIDGNNGYYKMNPPLRSKEDQFALIEGMLDGTIDLIATDHAPHSREEKAGDMRKAAFGIIGNETAFACLYTKFVKSGQMDLSLLLDLMSYQPAKLFGLDHAEKLAEEDYLSKGVNTPFTGQEVYGMTALTFVSGKLVYKSKHFAD
ncbi:dihydroorotase [Lactobacillus delbrueckii subsp. lactis DSM 20072]|uniref:dihydroorotase n=1 Tax=Lactobacillus delbrueckii TaxID=1584 RepID=UPI000202F339|nr:dihydroorotase [Lactobacillus delbrueckii]ASW12034.1 dihydroorotase [Lactobacillus delbrueckii subsp. lactis DSM 20072]EGD28259.1 dihydroorotase [Lactobacillus delbrueckii subsp. lactis DSM 20072]KRK66241.1 dihydroorotase [Lactobacillus delbrueckii subsp. lactis DSM 20072]MCT3500632.1 dihydroorotase [Lactobacillus delbrueckii subsp. lactis]OOV09644.1 dihydroorotase [Lactobacillus delbrueckii subsp. lactis DSM 20072]